jgi:hypothetical protein
MKCRLILVLLLLPGLAAPALAGIIFGKKATKPNPAERVPELLAQVKNDGDENKRSSAAEELRQYDPAAFPQIVPVLIDVLFNDKKSTVRAEAAQTLGKLRPVSQQVGAALEYALAKDPSMRVRLQARSSLLQYHWAGYRSTAKKNESPLLNTKEPPLADGDKAPPVIDSTTPAPTPVPNRLKPQPAPAPLPQTIAPPLPNPAPAGARPMPAGPAQPPKTQEPPRAPEEKGPDLGSPDR